MTIKTWAELKREKYAGQPEKLRQLEAQVRAIAQLQSVVDRFIAEAVAEGPTHRMKMLEVSIEVQPAMEAVVKAVTGAK